jgi:hypothetical protein
MEGNATINKVIDIIVNNPSLSVLACIFLIFIAGILMSMYERRKNRDRIKQNKKMTWLIG